ncbi:MAG: LysR family transcriptional regulator [Syntrophorhabdales bacterium]
MTDPEPIRYNSNMVDHAMKIMYKVWLDCDGKAFGEGPDRLLQRVETTGSLHKAAAEMKMSYRKAWLMLRAMEQRLGFTLLERKVGGVSGGGSQLTPAARELMKRYEAFRKEVEGALQEIYTRHFG